MPIYEYECKDCGHVFDALQKMSDDPLRDCPDCGKPELKKLLSAPNFRLKGGGWYETDFKDKNKRNLAGGDSDGKSGDSGKADSKGGDSKKDPGKKSESSASPAAKPVNKSD
jgi:putative FmdB family regulatory protein